MKTVNALGQTYQYERMDSDGVEDFWSIYYKGDFINVDVPCETGQYNRETKLIAAIEERVENDR